MSSAHPIQVERVGVFAFEKLYHLAQVSGLTQWTLKHYEDSLKSQRSIALLAKLAGVDAGFLVADLIKPEVELLQIGICPEFRRRGIARVLMHKFLALCCDLKCEKVFLEVRAGNVAAIDLYSSFDFRKVGRRASYYSQPVEDALLMQKSFYDISESS
jgi:ribosomal-protein-alanine acetyltransferase